MIIMFRGTKTSKNMAPQILSLYATINAAKYNRHTLVLQFMSEFPVEKILRGKRDEEEEVMDKNRYQFNDTGIDSLFRKIENQKLEKENFDMACKGMLRTENLLDVAEVSGKEDFVKEIITRQSHVKQLLEYASELYDDVYILGNGKIEELMKILNPLINLSIICVPQGNKEEVIEPVTLKDENDPNSGNDFLYLVTEYDRRSSFDTNKLKKFYEVKRIATLPYNTGFKDAYNSNNVLAYAVGNTEVKEHDANFDIFNEVFNVHKLVMKHEEPEEPHFNIKKLEQKIKEKKTAEAKTLDASNVRYTKKYTGFLFWKKETNSYEVTINGFDDEGQPKRLTGPVAETPEKDENDEFDFDENGDFEDTAEYEDPDDYEDYEEIDSMEEIDDMTWDDDDDDDCIPDEDTSKPDSDYEPDYDEDDEISKEEADEYINEEPKKRRLFGKKPSQKPQKAPKAPKKTEVKEKKPEKRRRA